MRLALPGLFEARWSARIHDEWTRNLLTNRPDLSPEQLQRTRDLMDAALPEAVVTGYEPLIETLHLPDSDDRHVLATAIHSGATHIVTFNLRDFPADTLAQSNVIPIAPDSFVVGLYYTAPNDFVSRVKSHRASLKKPTKTADEYLATLKQNHLTQIAALLQQHNEEI